MACSYCQALPAELFGNNDFQSTHAPTRAILNMSARAGCHSCSVFCTALDAMQNGQSDADHESEGPVVLHRHKEMASGPPLSIQCGERVGIVVFETDSGYTSGKRMSIAARADIPSNFQAVLGWISHCLEHHQHCPKPDACSTLPTRLLDVGPLDGSIEPRLCPGEECRKFGGRYLTLSYCWGTAMPLRTTRANVQNFSKEIRLDSLPQTLKDAVTITRKLGVRHIWIDALCIIQDEKDDWQREGGLMGVVYSQSLCTITALASNDCQDGIIKARDELRVTSALLHLPQSSGNGTVKTTIFPILPSWSQLNDKSRLNTRGWTLQERELSPRMLYYTTHQTVWECFSNEWIENLYDDRGPTHTEDIQPTRPRLFGKVHRGDPDYGVYYSWYRTVADFSSRHLTVPTDKLVALSGLGKKVQTLNSDTYIAGLWERDILHGLCWQISFHNNGRYRRPDSYIAPSWSWTSIDGPVWYEGTIFSRDRRISSTYDPPPPYSPKLLGYNIDLQGSDSFGQLKGGFISLLGKLKLADCRPINSTTTSPTELWATDAGQEHSVGNIMFDDSADVVKYTQVYCLCMFDWRDESERVGGGLALVKVRDSEKVKYRRVGYASWLNTDWYDDCEPSEIVII